MGASAREDAQVCGAGHTGVGQGAAGPQCGDRVVATSAARDPTVLCSETVLAITIIIIILLVTFSRIV